MTATKAPTVRSIAELIDALGGVETLRKDCITNVENWVHLNEIPAGWQMRLFARAIRQKVEFSAELLQDVFHLSREDADAIAITLGHGPKLQARLGRLGVRHDA